MDYKIMNATNLIWLLFHQQNIHWFHRFVSNKKCANLQHDSTWSFRTQLELGSQEKFIRNGHSRLNYLFFYKFELVCSFPISILYARKIRVWLGLKHVDTMCILAARNERIIVFLQHIYSHMSDDWNTFPSTAYNISAGRTWLLPGSLPDTPSFRLQQPNWIDLSGDFLFNKTITIYFYN